MFPFLSRHTRCPLISYAIQFVGHSAGRLPGSIRLGSASQDNDVVP